MPDRPVDRAAYSIKEAAAYIAVSRSRLLEIVEAGFITPVPLGERKLILRDDLDRLLAGLRDGTIIIPKRKRRAHETDAWRYEYAAKVKKGRQARKAAKARADGQAMA